MVVCVSSLLLSGATPLLSTLRRDPLSELTSLQFHLLTLDSRGSSSSSSSSIATTKPPLATTPAAPRPCAATTASNATTTDPSALPRAVSVCSTPLRFPVPRHEQLAPVVESANFGATPFNSPATPSYVDKRHAITVGMTVSQCRTPALLDEDDEDDEDIIAAEVAEYDRDVPIVFPTATCGDCDRDATSAPSLSPATSVPSPVQSEAASITESLAGSLVYSVSTCSLDSMKSALADVTAALTV